ncbi:four helix bundle protein [Anabaena sp. UHCC 0399]|uniref:four helix bundle protein n=1 Tax=Anabaena sp. UHCC 0399 TaxID=3110238 RepID=UPI002B20DCEB|nr:four helix bundle protein [Anabaena sp. UHCC 0399]MEA5567120.1 four helix bundle protein [Anabaena sp. UHCC 0399]
MVKILDILSESLAYRLANRLPDCERYNLSDHSRRAASSVLLNIAEGYGRYHYLDRLRFMYIARVPSPQSIPHPTFQHQVNRRLGLA